MLRTWSRSIVALAVCVLLTGAAHAGALAAPKLGGAPLVSKFRRGTSSLRVGMLALALVVQGGLAIGWHGHAALANAAQSPPPAVEHAHEARPTTAEHTLMKLTLREEGGVPIVQVLKDMPQVKTAHALRVTPKGPPGTLGYLSASYEGRSAAQVNPEPVKNRGWDYGVFQLNSAAGSVQDFVKTSRWRSAFDHLEVGTPAFNAKWAAIGKAHPDEFLAEQQAFMQNEMFSPVEQQLKDEYHIDIAHRSVGLQECIWSLSVSFGPDLAKKAIANAGVQDLAHKSDAKIINAVMGQKRDVEKYYPNSPELWDTLRARVDREKVVLLGLSKVKRDITPKPIS